MESSTKSVQADLNCKTKKASKYFFYYTQYHHREGCSFWVWTMLSEQVSKYLFRHFFVELFTQHLFKKIQDFIIYLYRDMCEIKKKFQTFWYTLHHILIDFKKFIITFSCLYFYYYKGRCYSVIYHLKGRHEYYKLI